jgi:hypothetical protein
MVGHVFLKKTRIDRLKNVYTFEIEKDGPFITETFMSQFKELPLNQNEKKGLSQNNRYELKFYRSIEEDDLIPVIDSFVHDLKMYYGKPLIVEASSTGAFLCLAAILSGKLPKDQNWTFELTDFPVAVFPENLIKSPNSLENYHINFQFHPNSWMNAYPTLKKAPSAITTQLKWRDYWSETQEIPNIVANHKIAA